MSTKKYRKNLFKFIRIFLRPETVRIIRADFTVRGLTQVHPFPLTELFVKKLFPLHVTGIFLIKGPKAAGQEIGEGRSVREPHILPEVVPAHARGRHGLGQPQSLLIPDRPVFK